jgi:hypothetical protein
MGSSVQARRGRSPEAAGFTLLAILVVLAALTLVVGMALQRGEDERRSAILVKHDALALSAAEFGLDRSRAYLGAILDKEGDLDKALDPLMNTNCESLMHLNPDAGTEDDNLPVIDGGVKLAYGGQDRPFLLVPYNADGDDAGTAEGAYLIRFDDNDDDGPGLALSATTKNNVGGALNCLEGTALSGYPAKTNTARDRDRVVVVTVVGIAPGTDVTRAQARKVLRARVGSGPAAGLITGGTIDLKGASHVCGAYANVSVSDGGFEDGCVCGASCSKGPPDQSCGNGNVCNIQTASSTCKGEFGGAGGVCLPGANVPPAPKVEVWSTLNAPPKCTTAPCTPFYYLRADKFTVPLPLGALGSDNPQVFMWDYTACPDPQAFSRIHYPGEPGVVGTEWTVAKALLPTGGCWRLVYDGNSVPAACAGKDVRIQDSLSLTSLTPPNLTTVCATAPKVWLMGATVDATPSSFSSCDSPSTLYPDVGANRYKRHYRTGGSVIYSSGSPIPRGVWLVDGKLTFSADTPNIGAMEPVTILATGDVYVSNGTTVALKPAHRDVALLAGRDLEVKGGNSYIYTCGKPSTLTPSTVCPSAAIMVHEQFKMGSNTHVQGQVVVQNVARCSDEVPGTIAVQSNGNSTISVPAMPPIYSPGGTSVLSWGEGSY